MAEETKESQFHAMATANKVSTGPTGFGGTWSVAQKAYQALVESATVAEWVAEALKPDATPVLRGFTASAIIEIEKKKPSEENATAVVPFLAAATAWKDAVKIHDGTMEMGVSLQDHGFNAVYQSIPKDDRTSIVAPGVVKILSEEKPSKRLPESISSLLSGDLNRPGDLRKLRSLGQ